MRAPSSSSCLPTHPRRSGFLVFPWEQEYLEASAVTLDCQCQCTCLHLSFSHPFSFSSPQPVRAVQGSSHSLLCLFLSSSLVKKTAGFLFCWQESWVGDAFCRELFVCCVCLSSFNKFTEETLLGLLSATPTPPLGGDSLEEGIT